MSVTMARDPQLISAKRAFLENLETIQTALIRCVEEGMLDLDDDFYNELLGLIEDAHTLDNWDELSEATTRAKTLEVDIASWLARQGRTTLSLSWPKKPK